MAKKIYFILGIHNHQPVGNFPEVFERGYEVCYWPFIQAMKKHPKIKWSLHLSGILWDYFEEKHPKYIDEVKLMVKKGQLELITGGYFEPIIPVIPDADKKGQLLMLNKYLKERFDYKPKGMWLTERVWEPNMPSILSPLGIEYTSVDDTHFLSAGRDPEKLNGYYVTEDQGFKMNIFPISKDLRYYIPFKTIEDNIDYFRAYSGKFENPLLVMADDGEKFGMWPGTNKHCYEDGWLENFLSALDANSDWIAPVTYSEYLENHKPSGIIHLPAASYFEMSEWAFPSDTQEEFENVVNRFSKDPVVNKYLKGGFWRNFLSKYPESNNMHKKMVFLSSKLSSKKTKLDKSVIQKATHHLYAGQCNCAYWHGVFGGLYLPHLRSGIYRELLSAESLIRQNEPEAVKVEDFNSDGFDEVLFEGKNQNIYIAKDCGASIVEWDLLRNKTNMQNVLARRFESYHSRLKKIIEGSYFGDDTVKSIHDIVKVKENNLDNYLHYDWYNRNSLIDHFIHTETKIDDFRKCKYGEQGDFVLASYNFSAEDKTMVFERQGSVWVNNKEYGVKLSKKIKPKGEGFEVSYAIRNIEDITLDTVFSTEFNLAFSYSKEPEMLEIKNAKSWKRHDEVLGLDLEIKTDLECSFWIFPVETVSLSEDGFERTYQGTSVSSVFRLSLGAGEEKEINLKVLVKHLK